MFHSFDISGNAGTHLISCLPRRFLWFPRLAGKAEPGFCQAASPNQRTMKALITGAEGFVGQHLARHLASRGLDVWGTCLMKGQEPLLLENGCSKGMPCDITKEEELRNCLERCAPDWIFHLAGQSYIPISWDDPQVTFRSNLGGTLLLLQALVRVNSRSRLLFVSSGAIYGKSYGIETLNERSPCRPTTPYGVSKLAADALIEVYVDRYGLDVVRVRPFNHTGPGQRQEFALPTFSAQIARAEQGLGPPRLEVGNLDVYRDISDVRDMVEAYALALAHGKKGGAYNVARGTSIHLREAVVALAALSQVPLSLEVDAERVRADEPGRVDVDVSLFREATGWFPKIPFEKTLSDLLDYWRQVVALEAR